MNEARRKQLLAGQSSLAQKAYEFVPIQEAWSCTDIHRAMTSQGVTSTSYRVLRACLGELKDQKIIRSPKPDFFQRDPDKGKSVVQPYERDDRLKGGYTPNGLIIKETKTVPKNPPTGRDTVPAKAAVATTESTASKPVSSVEMLTELAVDFVDFAEQIAKAHKAFASRIENLAAQIETDLNSNAEELEKLRSLKSLLKSLG